MSSPERYSTQKNAAVKVSDSHLLQIHKVLLARPASHQHKAPTAGWQCCGKKQTATSAFPANPNRREKKKKVSPEAACPLFCKDGLSHLPASLLQIQKKNIKKPIIFYAVMKSNAALLCKELQVHLPQSIEVFPCIEVTALRF